MCPPQSLFSPRRESSFLVILSGTGEGSQKALDGKFLEVVRQFQGGFFFVIIVTLILLITIRIDHRREDKISKQVKIVVFSKIHNARSVIISF